MSIGITAQYLAIEWQEPERARFVELGPEPVEIERAEDGTLRLEVEIFPEDHAWLGLRLSGELSRAKPALISPDGQCRPLIAVEDAEGARWWVPALDWDGIAKRHLNAAYRGLGTFEITVGDERLEVVAITHGRSRVVLEDYLRDFQNDLIWLVLGFDGTGGTAGEKRIDQPLVAMLGDFTSALSRIAKRPASEMSEITGEARIAKLRPNAATFRQHSRMPAAPRLPSRLAEESADIPDNRFLRHMTAVCADLARSLGEAAERQADLLKSRARVEAKRGEGYRQTEHQQVDPAVFDRQLAEIEERLGAVKRWHNDEPMAPPDQREFSFPIRLKGRYGKGQEQFFYERLNPGPADDDASYRVVRLPQALASLIFGILHFSKDYTFRGTAKSEVKSDKKGKRYRLIELQRISNVESHSQAVANKRRKRAQLEQDGWRARLSSKERAEYQQAAQTAEKRSAKFREMAEHAERAGTALCESLSALRTIDLGLLALGIGTSSQMPTGMRYSMHPDYAACLAAYQRLQALTGRLGPDESALQSVERIGTLHASALYERWCLVKILTILITEYGFLPPPGWQEQLITAVTGIPEAFSLALCRPEINFGALLEVQPLLGNGRRPDFRLRFAYLPANLTRPATGGGLAPVDLASFADKAGLIMDAKFRTRWKLGEMERTLETLIAQKRYDSEGDRVFLLHPVAETVGAPTSPLEWGAHCDYGHDPGSSHRRGTVWLAPDVAQGDAQRHLRRLIGLELQASFTPPIEVERGKSRETMLKIRQHVRRVNPAPVRHSRDWGATIDAVSPDEQKIWISPSFCLSCGQVHEPEDITERLTRGKRIYWQLNCSACEMVTTRTHCYGSSCDATLFKNHLGATYHRTIANQPTNVVCPSCGVYFDEDWSGEFERDAD
ncbi:hypothetical protein GYB70_12905 [Sinorhizobium meliloti]|nr:hypothetical protein [Sinorhizobium meliloti]